MIVFILNNSATLDECVILTDILPLCPPHCIVMFLVLVVFFSKDYLRCRHPTITSSDNAKSFAI